VTSVPTAILFPPLAGAARLAQERGSSREQAELESRYHRGRHHLRDRIFVASDFDLASLGIIHTTKNSTKFTEHLWLGFDHRIVALGVPAIIEMKGFRGGIQ
jgi:hypothetical protein